MAWMPIRCSGCLYWERIEEDNPKEDQKAKGYCHRYPYPGKLQKDEDWWCGEGLNSGVNAIRGRNKV